MDKVAIDDVDVPTPNPAERAVPLSDVLGTNELAINYYELATGQRFGFDVHRHMDQEEVFYIQQGTVTFQLADGEVVVGPREVIRFAPGEFQLGVNHADELVKAVGLGAPRGSRDIEYLRECLHCDDETVQTLEPSETGVFRVTCNRCERETVREEP